MLNKSNIMKWNEVLPTFKNSFLADVNIEDLQGADTDI